MTAPTPGIFIELGGFCKIMPVASAFFITAALCGAGVPGFASFWAELLVFIAAVKVFGVGGLIALASIVCGRAVCPAGGAKFLL